jgi:hypothetical protein
MLYNKSDLEQEIKRLHGIIHEKRSAFGEGMRRDVEFQYLKSIYKEIRELEKRLELCFEESRSQQ